MISEKVIDYLREKECWFVDETDDYKEALKSLDIDLNSDFSYFYLHADDGPTFLSRGKELYQICWFIINSNYDQDINRSINILGLPEDYIPLDSFEGGYGYFYNRKSENVIQFKLGDSYQGSECKVEAVKWKDFNSFIEWYFGL